MRWSETSRSSSRSSTPRAEFKAAKLVHVISTRFKVDKAVDTGGAFGRDQ